MRHRDIHVLTVNTYTYTSDQRFQTAHHKDTDEWTLQIKYVQERDKGSYECQVSTQPVKSYIVSLNVVGKCCPVLCPTALSCNTAAHDHSAVVVNY